MKTEIIQRIDTLRKAMRKAGVQAYLVPSTDPHAGEYIPEHWESRKWLSGFTGSAGTLVVTTDKAGLWTDSRYYLQAATQLADTGIELFKDGLPETPGINQWLCQVLNNGTNVGFDGEVNTTAYIQQLAESLHVIKAKTVDAGDLLQDIWTNRPAIPTRPITILDVAQAGIDATEKLSTLRAYLQERGSDNALLLTALDEIAWTLNLRGSDVPYNPVFVSYLYIAPTTTYLFTDKEKLSDEVQIYLAQSKVEVRPYDSIFSFVSQEARESNIYLPAQANYKLHEACSHNRNVHLIVSPVSTLKAQKNETEIAGFRKAMERDGVALVRFWRWLLPAVQAGGQTEISISEKLETFRAAQENYRGASFHTIAGYAANGAIVHYSATPDSCATLQPKGLLLLDSGGQYIDGTTDITRTIALGELTEEEKTDYTLVLKGFIALSCAHFLAGTCGTQLDVLARQFMWREGINYGHGTGHGVGHYLNVHEGPHQIRMNNMPAPLLPGSTVTNEPGIYRAGKHGIRTENILLTVEDKRTDFGTFLCFETLTLCPIDKAPIRTELLTKEEKEWLDAYHAHVYERLSPYLDAEECEWLRKATAAI